ncbi:pyruvate kinase PKM [Caerostris extrusa]|uniref:Pyruvate kinase n=1 Tax=Caerostris extrusa TaxID=172846 RepID=A0AAV4S9N4_CAEEX|nr:pyruvate kinase PKM [Caerostris extrusa]
MAGPRLETNMHQLQASAENNILNHLRALSIDSHPIYPRLTGIICTISIITCYLPLLFYLSGPATKEVDTLVDLIKAGMNVVRLNFSHGSYEYHANTIKNARKAIRIVAGEEGLETYPIAIALDTKGPEIRTGILRDGVNTEVELVRGKRVKVTTDNKFAEKCTADTIYVDYKNLTKVVQEKSIIYVDDGLLCLVVKSVGSNSVDCVIENGGMLGSNKGCNLPGAEVDLPAASEKRQARSIIRVEQGVDMIFASFIRNADGVKEIRNILGKKRKTYQNLTED